MAQAIEHVVLNKTKEITQANTFYSLSCDEVTLVDCQSWINVHGYVVRDWKQNLLLLTLERVVEGGRTLLVLSSMLHVLMEVAQRKINREGMITFGADLVSTFKAAKSNILVQLITKHKPFVVGVHCVAHCTNLVVQTLTNFEVMKHVEDALATPCPYFSSSAKPTLEFHKFATCLESKGNHIIRNIKTRWVSMFRPTKRVLRNANLW